MADTSDAENQLNSWSMNDEDSEVTKKRSRLHTRIQFLFRQHHRIVLSVAGDEMSVLVSSENNIEDLENWAHLGRRPTTDNRNSTSTVADSRSTNAQSIVDTVDNDSDRLVDFLDESVELLFEEDRVTKAKRALRFLRSLSHPHKEHQQGHERDNYPDQHKNEHDTEPPQYQHLKSEPKQEHRQRQDRVRH